MMDFFYNLIFKECKMKKILLSLVAVGMLATSGMADEWITGKVVQIEKWGSLDTMFYISTAEDCTVKAMIATAEIDPDSQKLIQAMALTAQSADKYMQIYIYGDPVCGSSTANQGVGFKILSQAPMPAE